MPPKKNNKKQGQQNKPAANNQLPAGNQVKTQTPVEESSIKTQTTEVSPEETIKVEQTTPQQSQKIEDNVVIPTEPALVEIVAQETQTINNPDSTQPLSSQPENQPTADHKDNPIIQQVPLPEQVVIANTQNETNLAGHQNIEQSQTSSFQPKFGKITEDQVSIENSQQLVINAPQLQAPEKIQKFYTVQFEVEQDNSKIQQSLQEKSSTSPANLDVAETVIEIDQQDIKEKVEEKLIQIPNEGSEVIQILESAQKTQKVDLIASSTDKEDSQIFYTITQSPQEQIKQKAQPEESSEVIKREQQQVVENITVEALPQQPIQIKPDIQAQPTQPQPQPQPQPQQQRLFQLVYSEQIQLTESAEIQVAQSIEIITAASVDRSSNEQKDIKLSQSFSDLNYYNSQHSQKKEVKHHQQPQKVAQDKIQQQMIEVSVIQKSQPVIIEQKVEERQVLVQEQIKKTQQEPKIQTLKEQSQDNQNKQFQPQKTQIIIQESHIKNEQSHNDLHNEQPLKICESQIYIKSSELNVERMSHIQEPLYAPLANIQQNASKVEQQINNIVQQPPKSQKIIAKVEDVISRQQVKVEVRHERKVQQKQSEPIKQDKPVDLPKNILKETKKESPDPKPQGLNPLFLIGGSLLAIGVGIIFFLRRK